MSPSTPPIALLREAFLAAVDAVSAAGIVPPHLPPPTRGGLLVIGAGKAAAAMALAVESHWPAASPLAGLAITRHGHGLATRRIEVVEAGHPLPDARGMEAARRVLDLLDATRAEDSVLVLLSGGGSSLLALPEDGLELADIREVTAALLRSGAPIGDINIVRKHLSRGLGGKLAARLRCPARVLIVSDVVGDDPASIASGPFHADPSSYADALAVLARWSVTAPPAVIERLRLGVQGAIADTPKPGSSCFDAVETRIVARAADALNGARAYFEARGIEVTILGDAFEDEARVLAGTHAELALNLAKTGHARPRVLLSGGETRVRVSGTGRGGRNSEYLLALALHLRGHPRIHALAADTDGIDGTQDNAGAWLAPEDWDAARALGLDAADHLARNDAWGFFAGLGGLLVTGPTRTNVNDYRAILIS